MIKRIFITASAVAGLVAFFTFRTITHPLELALDCLLLLAFVGSSLLCASGFLAVCRRVRSRWMRVAAVFLFLPAFTLLPGLGVFGATRIVFESRPRSPDDGGLLYGDTSGMQMLALDSDLWFYVVGTMIVPLALFFVAAVVAAFTGIYAPQIRNRAA